MHKEHEKWKKKMNVALEPWLPDSRITSCATPRKFRAWKIQTFWSTFFTKFLGGKKNVFFNIFSTYVRAVHTWFFNSTGSNRPIGIKIEKMNLFGFNSRGNFKNRRVVAEFLLLGFVNWQKVNFHSISMCFDKWNFRMKKVDEFLQNSQTV